MYDYGDNIEGYIDRWTAGGPEYGGTEYTIVCEGCGRFCIVSKEEYDGIDKFNYYCGNKLGTLCCILSEFVENPW